MRKVAALLLLIILVISASLLALIVFQKSAPKFTGPVENIRIGNIGEFSIFNIIAQKNGYFKDYGLNAKITEFASGPPAVTALLSGQVDVAVAADFVGVNNIFTNPNLRILSQESRHDVFHLLARRDKKITLPSDLKLKRIGVTKKSAGEFYLGKFLSANDIKTSDVTIINLTPLQIDEDLVNGSIDAAVIFDPHAYNLQKKMGDNLISWDAQSGQKTYALLYSTDAFIKAHPEIVNRYISAMLEAEDFTSQHTLEAQQIIATSLKYDPAYVKYMWQNFTFEQSLDQELLITMEDQAKWLIDNNLTTQKAIPNYLDFIYFDSLTKIKPESITIIH